MGYSDKSHTTGSTFGVSSNNKSGQAIDREKQLSGWAFPPRGGFVDNVSCYVVDSFHHQCTGY